MDRGARAEAEQAREKKGPRQRDEEAAQAVDEASMQHLLVAVLDHAQSDCLVQLCDWVCRWWSDGASTLVVDVKLQL